MVVYDGDPKRHPGEFPEIAKALIERVAASKLKSGGWGTTTIEIVWKAGKPDAMKITDTASLKFADA